MISGDYLVAKINGVLIEGVMGWRVSESSVKLPGQTGVNRGKTANKHGSLTASVNLEIVQDITSTPYIPVAANTVIEELQLFRHIDDTVPAFEFPIFNVFDSDNGSRMGDSFKINCSGENDGDYFRDGVAV